MTVQREEQADRDPDLTAATPADGEGARSFTNLERQEEHQQHQQHPPARPELTTTRSHHSHRRIVKDEKQVENSPSSPVPQNPAQDEVEGEGGVGDEEGTPITELLALRRKRNEETAQMEKGAQRQPDLAVSGDMVTPDTGATGKRPFLDGISLPFSLGKSRNKQGDNASMVTLNSMDPASPRVLTPNPDVDNQTAERQSQLAMASLSTPLASPTSLASRPELERFVTAQTTVPTVATPSLKDHPSGSKQV